MNLRFTLALALLFLCCLINLNFTRARLFDRVVNRISKIRSQLKDVLENESESLADFLGDFKEGITRKLNQVGHCYEAGLGEHQINIFNGSLSFKSIAQSFYETFSDKQITLGSIRELRASIREIIGNCLTGRGSTAKFGFTEFSDKSPEEMSRMMGAITPNFNQTESKETKSGILNRFGLNRGKRSTARNRQCQLDERSRLPPSIDWRSADKVTPVKNQGVCGSCWSFATLAAIESALLIQQSNRASSSRVDLSEQHLLNCAIKSGCSGGHSEPAFRYIQERGFVSEADHPYRGREGFCGRSRGRPNFIRDYCIRGRLRHTADSVSETLSDQTIMQALVQKGPLYLLINGDRIKNYRGGVFNSWNCAKKPNHAVLLIGYDGRDNSWIMKNSWGRGWGAAGYLKVARGKNMCGVNTEIAWPIL